MTLAQTHCEEVHALFWFGLKHTPKAYAQSIYLGVRAHSADTSTQKADARGLLLSEAILCLKHLEFLSQKAKIQKEGELFLQDAPPGGNGASERSGLLGGR